MEKETFICSCCSLEHQVTFFNEEDGVYLYLHLTTHRNIFQRMKYAFKYVFGYKCRYGAFDEFEFQEADLNKLKKFLDERK